MTAGNRGIQCPAKSDVGRPARDQLVSGRMGSCGGDLVGFGVNRLLRVEGMLELGPDNVVEYLHASGRLDPAVAATAHTLAWGVSNAVLRIQPTKGDDFVLKQSRGKLRTEADWFSRLDRIFRECELMQTLAPLLPTGTVPEVLFEDRDNYLFAMEAVQADHTVWKADLLAGRADTQIAARMGTILAAIHRETAGNAVLRDQWGDTEVFVQLRVDPFYRRIAQVHPDLRKPVESMIATMFDNPLCVVHADFSPKNILLTTRGPVLVDFETGHFGDPAFDLGFFLSHLLLKTVLFASRRSEYLALVKEFLKRYFAELRVPDRSSPMSSSALAGRTIPHLAACMLSRIDGTSRIDYLREERQQKLVRHFCRDLFLSPPTDLNAVFDKLDGELSKEPS